MIGGLIFRSYLGKNDTLYGKGAYFAKAGNYAYAAQPLYAKPQSDGTQRLILTWVLEGERTIGYLLLLFVFFFVFIIILFLLYYLSGSTRENTF